MTPAGRRDVGEPAGLRPAGSRAARESAAAQQRLTAFTDRHGLQPDADAVCLYLSSLAASGASGPGVRTELRRLDLHARLSGALPHSRHEQVRRLVRGIHASSPARPAQQHHEPLYTEDLAALVDAVGPPRTARRDVAALLLADACHLPAAVLRELRWHQVHLTPGGARLELPPQARAHSARGHVDVPNGPPGLCPVDALWALRRARSHAAGDDHVLGTAGRRPAIATIAAAVAGLPGRGGKWHSPGGRCPPAALAQLVADATRDGPREHRDRSLLTLSFAACLTTTEARGLLLRHVRREPGGLLLDLPGRTTLTAVPQGSAAERCPVRLWDTWHAALSRLAWDPALPAFPVIHYGAVLTTAGSQRSLNDTVRDRCDAAGLGRGYDFTSLRTGFLRSAARAGVPAHLTAAQAGLRYLDSVERHRVRERRLTDSAAARVGL